MQEPNIGVCFYSHRTIFSSHTNAYLKHTMKSSVELLPTSEAALDGREGPLDAGQLHVLHQVFERQPLAASDGFRARKWPSKKLTSELQRLKITSNLIRGIL